MCILGSSWSIVGGWCNAIRNPLFARCHPICGDVRSNGTGSDFHDPSVWNYMQWRYIRRYHTDIVTRNVRYVLRFCNICHLWTGTKCHTTCPRLILPNTSSIRCYLAHWRNAIYSKVSIIRNWTALSEKEREREQDQKGILTFSTFEKKNAN